MDFRSERAKRWFDRLSESNHMLWLLGFISFMETIIVPIPIEVVLIPLMAINRHRIWTLATVATAGCLAASLTGYGVGMVLYQSLGTWFIDMMGMQSAYESFQSFFDQYGFAAIIAVGIIPIPFQVAMITAGLSGYPIHLFVLAALIARGVRYYGLAWLILQFGERIAEMWNRHTWLTSLGGIAVIAALMLLTRALANQVM